MLDIAPTELLLVAFVAIIIIGPKDLPKAMRVAGYWVGRARGVARQFRQGFDNIVREAELAEMEKKWKEENERIMREHPPESLLTAESNGSAASVSGGGDTARAPDDAAGQESDGGQAAARAPGADTPSDTSDAPAPDAPASDGRAPGDGSDAAR
ncbi:Sec-independent protein translocase protein TatB [Stakelama saccharophila]|uniref:Sec-independent protein translocase protein TatB n=1 Tax=Stakelama saccharophila TaxID=3075605 RepID=A0ABZ0BDD8_9SPHN|nr:Sec-independent protein translocase protein TatB [Stakelama sp. W311]WNO54908.1 Sec-independent protein translocase protein TatB [Stakelama sp. W311]